MERERQQTDRTLADGAGTINTTSYIAVGDPYLKPRAKIHGEMMNRPQMGGSSHLREFCHFADALSLSLHRC